jgi:hypothetical protein
VQAKWPIAYAGARNREAAVMNKPETLEALFVGRHFDREVIILCVRWYLRFKLRGGRAKLNRPINGFPA